MSRELVFIHGRAQQHKDPDALKQAWIAAWKTGLKSAKLPMPIDESAIRFPYYGNTLVALLEHQNDIPDVLIRGKETARDEEFLPTLAAVLEEVRVARGVSDAQVRAAAAKVDPASAEMIEKGPQNWRWVRAVARALDDLPGLSGTAVALATADVWVYLKDAKTRAKIDLGVRGALPPEADAVVVGHSLGSVVAYNLLQADGELGRWTVPLFTTVGSPLGVRAIRELIEPTKHPACVSTWFNAMDPDDIVALHPLEEPFFRVTPPIVNKTNVRNQTPNQHGIAGYLGDPVVAARLHEALVRR